MMTDDDEPARARPPDGADGACPDLQLLKADYPAFDFSQRRYGRHGRCWVAIRHDSAIPGLHTVITSDLAEMNAALVIDAVLTPGRRSESRNAALRSTLL